MGAMTHDEALEYANAQLQETMAVLEATNALLPRAVEVAEKMVAVFEGGGHVYFFGNGGSAADAQHWAAELSGRFHFDRDPLPAVALTTNSSAVTAIGNDYGYDEVFARPLKGLVRDGDMVIGISTSGNSANVLRAFEVARAAGAVTVGFTGASGGKMADLCDVLVNAPSSNTPRVQEAHEFLAHTVCALVEKRLFE